MREQRVAAGLRGSTVRGPALRHVFGEDERLELVEGEIVEMSPIGPRHMEAVIALTAILAPMLNRYDLSVQMPLTTGSDGEPQPDMTLLRKDRAHMDERLSSGQRRVPEGGGLVGRGMVAGGGSRGGTS